MSVIKWIDMNAEKVLASALLAAIVLLIFGNVFMRYIMNASLSWGEELTLWLFVWFVWLGVSYAFHTGDHVRITVLRDVLGERARLFADVVIALLVLGFLLVLTVECIKLIMMPFIMLIIMVDSKIMPLRICSCRCCLPRISSTTNPQNV